MNIVKRSTSPLMKEIFGDDINIILHDYNRCIIDLSKKYPYLKSTFYDCISRTGFLFPYMSVEYGYHSMKRSFVPEKLRELILSFGLLGLVASIDDDTIDECRYNNLKMMSNICVSEVIQNTAYLKLLQYSSMRETSVVVSEIKNALKSLIEFQYLDASNIVNFSNNGFDLSAYLKATYKTVCPIKYGVRLGILLADGRESDVVRGEKITEYLGMVLQLFDDLLDIEDDMTNYKNPITLPMFLAANGQSFDMIFKIVDSNLKKSLELSAGFPYQEKVLSMIQGFKRAESIVKHKISSKLFSKV